jgi:hypothetical protein
MQLIARLFRMDDEGRRRHANLWSVYTRFAAVPALILAVWSCTWIGWWSLLPVAGVVLWLFIKWLLLRQDEQNASRHNEFKR